MTAGAVSALMLTERKLHGQDMTRPPRIVNGHISPHLVAGIEWLDNNFRLHDKAEESDWYYYMWCMQNVGRATGYRTFNGVDWYREVTSEIMNRQDSRGRWRGPKGRLLSTSFALLFLGQANDPLAISKVRWRDKVEIKVDEKKEEEQAKGDNKASEDQSEGGRDVAMARVGAEIVEEDGKRYRMIDGRWNNRPHDIWNFVDYISEQYEYATTWQIADLSMKPYSLIESALLYMASDEPFSFNDEELDNLKGYLQAGGMLVINPDGGNRPDIRRSVQDMANKMFPGLSMERIRESHPIYSIHQELGPRVPMEVVSNGVRPLMVYLLADIGDGLQGNRTLRSDAFPALSNLYLYVTGMDPHRKRLDNHYVVQDNPSPRVPLPVARIKHSGNYDPEPQALTQLKAILANEHDVDMTIDTIGAQDLGPHKLAFLTTLGEARLPMADAEAIREWVMAGGTLVMDACTGNAESEQAARKLLDKIMPTLVPVPMNNQSAIVSGRGLRSGHDCQRVRWRLHALRKMGSPIATQRLQVIEVRDRPAIIYSAEDLTCGVAGLDHWNIFGYTSEAARKLAVNIALYATRNRMPSRVMAN